MKLIQAVLLLSTAGLLAGCPETGDNGDTNGSTNVGTNGATNGATNTGTNGGTNNGDPQFATVVVEVVEMEWGLTESFQARSSAYNARNEGSSAVADVQLPSGAFALRVESDGMVVIDATSSQTDRLIPISGDVTTQPFFNPAPMSATVDVRHDAGVWTASIGRRTGGDDLELDDPGPLTTVGSWFDDGIEEVRAAADPGAAVVELTDMIREHGGPVHTDDGVLFIAPAQDSESAPQIRGTWNDFAEDSASQLHRVTPGLWARFIQMPAGQQEYKIYYPDGDVWFTDISNPHIVWDGFDPGTVGSFNSVIGATGARTVWMPRTDTPQLGNSRDVYVHLPASYDASTADYPALYLHDGNESIVRGQFQIVADETAEIDPATEAILVFVALPSQDVRLDEYTLGTPGSLGDQYVDFLAETLVPQIDAQFRTRADRVARGVGGASLGGLISFWAAVQHPSVFGYSAGMSSSFFWGENFLIDEIQNRGCQDVAYYLDSGSPDDNFDVTQLMRDVLDGMGCDYEYVLETGGQHDWAYWRGRFDGVLEDFARTHGG